MNGGKHIAREKGTTGAGVHKRIEALIKEKPWLVIRALSTLPESDRRKLRWVLAKV